MKKKKIYIYTQVHNRKFNLCFCSLNEGGTKIKVAKVLKDYGNTKVRFFFKFL